MTKVEGVYQPIGFGAEHRVVVIRGRKEVGGYVLYMDLTRIEPFEPASWVGTKFRKTNEKIKITLTSK